MVIIASKHLILRIFFALGIIGAGIFMLLNLAIVDKKYDLNRSSTEIKINLLLPMEKESVEKNLVLKYSLPSQSPKYSLSWVNSTTFKITFFDQKLPKGQEMTLELRRAKSKISFIMKSYRLIFRIPVSPQVISIGKMKINPTSKPIVIEFNTPMAEETITKEIKVFDKVSQKIVEGSFAPKRYYLKNKSYLDRSVWIFKPKNNLSNNKEYIVRISNKVKSEGNLPLAKNVSLSILTPPKPEVVSILPSDNAKNISLFPKIKIIFNMNLKGGEVILRQVGKNQHEIGKVEPKENTLLISPNNILLPGSTYLLEGVGYSTNGEPTDRFSFSFSTISMQDRYWVDVKLGQIHTVTVYKGQHAVRHMIASGGKDSSQTPSGTFYTGDKGYSFWSPRFGEGALYWVRLVGQVLIHSVPRDHKGEVIDEEHAKLGIPASHGCIRLDDTDAKWFFENIPNNTPVIIHN